MVAETLTLLENWYREPSDGTERPKLISKLAIIEFCGWLEGWMDDVLREVDKNSLNDSYWLEKNVILRTSGFDYSKHFRPMLCSVLGEHKVRQVEARFEQENPGALEDIKSDLSGLWKKRCSFAHADLGAHQAAQINFDAPSWTKNTFRVVSKRLEAFQQCLIDNI